MTKEKIKSREHEKDQIIKVLFIIGIGLLIGIIATNIKANISKSFRPNILTLSYKNLLTNWKPTANTKG